MSVLCFVFIIAIKIRQWCLECIPELRRRCQDKRFPAVQGFTETRMHSSRMRTDRSLTVCWSLLPGVGECKKN